MAPHHVLHVIKGLGPGGAERLLVSLTVAWAGTVRSDVAYVLPGKAHLVGELERAGAGTHLIGGRRGLADPRWVVRLRRLVADLRPDVVHLHSPAVAAVARPVLRASRRRPAIVTTEHNQWGSFTPATRLLNAATAPLDDVRIAVSDDVRRSMWGSIAATTEVLEHGVPVAALSARRGERHAARADLGVSDDDVVVVIVANFREKKDYPTAMSAAAEAADRDASLVFVSVGQGPLEGQLAALHRRLDLGDRWRFLGYRSDSARVLAAADVFTLTSRHEGLPIALLEALALGVPVVVSAVGGIPAVVTDGVEGRLVRPGDVDAFAGAYVEMASDPARRSRCSQAALARAADFDIAGAAGALGRAYDRATQRARRR